MDIEPWTPESRKTVRDCHIFQLEELRSRRADQAAAGTFYLLETPAWVNIVALTADDRLVLVEQWRHAVERVTLEIPGGMVDPGETPFEAAARELFEETGYRSDEWHLLGSVEPNPAILTNRCYTFLAMNARPDGEPRFDTHEQCRLTTEPWPRARELVAEGVIAHSLVIAALHWEDLRREGLIEPKPADTH